MEKLQCRLCLEVKPLDDFGINKNCVNRFNRDYYCYVCRRAAQKRTRNNKEKKKRFENDLSIYC